MPRVEDTGIWWSQLRLRMMASTADWQRDFRVTAVPESVRGTRGVDRNSTLAFKLGPRRREAAQMMHLTGAGARTNYRA